MRHGLLSPKRQSFTRRREDAKKSQGGMRNWFSKAAHKGLDYGSVRRLLRMVSGDPSGDMRCCGVGHVSDERFETLMAPERRVAGNRTGLAALEKGAGPCANVQRMGKWVMRKILGDNSKSSRRFYAACNC